MQLKILQRNVEFVRLMHTIERIVLDVDVIDAIFFENRLEFGLFSLQDVSNKTLKTFHGNVATVVSRDDDLSLAV
jgi:hypothetical protein